MLYQLALCVTTIMLEELLGQSAEECRDKGLRVPAGTPGSAVFWFSPNDGWLEFVWYIDGVKHQIRMTEE